MLCIRRWAIGVMFLILVFVGCSQETPTVGDSRVIFVDGSRDFSGDGTSWETAFNDLQQAIDQAGAVASEDAPYQVWVKALDTPYIPKDDPNIQGRGEPLNAENHFTLRSHVAVYGGFAGSEDSLQECANVKATILSGDLGSGIHAYHVLYMPHAITITNASLQGVTISGGEAVGLLAEQNDRGAGVYVEDQQIDFIDCNFTQNNAHQDGHIGKGGALYISQRDDFAGGLDTSMSHWVKIQGCSFVENTAGMGGAIYVDKALGVYITGSSFNANHSYYGGNALGASSIDDAANERERLRIVSCSFTENSLRTGVPTDVEKHGGALHLHDTKALVDKTVFMSNSIEDEGGAIALTGDIDITGSSLLVYNSLFAKNTAATGKGGALAMAQTTRAELYHLTIADNSDRALYCSVAHFIGMENVLVLDDDTSWLDKSGTTGIEIQGPQDDGVEIPCNLIVGLDSSDSPYLLNGVGMSSIFLEPNADGRTTTEHYRLSSSADAVLKEGFWSSNDPYQWRNLADEERSNASVALGAF